MTTAMYVVESHPAKERVAVEHLSLQGFDPLLPLRCVAGGRPRPLFPSIVFVSIDMEEPGMRVYSRSISYTRGVKRIYGGEHPTPIRKREAMLILAQCAGGPLDEAAWRSLVVGLDVKVTEGPWADWQGVIEGFTSDRRMAQLVIGAWRVWQAVTHLEPA